jgi:stage II sporulation protein GA (sporulation sigma-E factor processing peptidase)
MGFLVNYFLLSGTAKIMHKHIHRVRLSLSALLGSLSSLIIFMPELGNFTLLLIRIISALIMVIIAFSCDTFKEIYITSLLFFFVSFVFAGIEYGISLLMGGSNTVWNNSVLYVDISLLTLCISTIAAYTVLRFLRILLDGRGADTSYTVTIESGGKAVSFKAKTDSGNNLTDTFSGKPVIICPKSSVSGIFDETAITGMLHCNYIDEVVTPPKGWKLIPFSTINSNGLIPAFAPAVIMIKNDENKTESHIDAYIGISETDMEYALFNPKLINAA